MTPHTQAAFVTSFVDREGRPPTPQEVWDAAIRSYRDLAQPASVPAEWKLVPVEPTTEMLDAARAACEGRIYSQDMRHGPRAMMADRWAAMLAASPQAPQPAQAVPAPEPEVWLYDFMDGATTVRNWSTTNKAEAYAPGNFNQRGYVPAEN